MTRSLIIVVSGLPGAGKSTVASWLKQQLSWPLLAKDDIKEQLFDTLGVGDAEWSSRLSLTSYGLMFTVAHQLAETGAPFIIEGNFRWQQTRGSFEALSANAQFIQLWCTASETILADRLRARAEHDVRHPGHRDREHVATLIEQMRSRSHEPLPLAGELIALDTSTSMQELEQTLLPLVQRLRRR